MADLKTKFGKKLRQLRKERDFTQEKLSDKTGLSIESISNIERGIFGPKFDNLEKIAKVLKIDVKQLFDF
jgi:transcriptional regulator with XRE-family HTH domain